MVARILSLATLAVALLGNCMEASAQNGVHRLQVGDLLPTLAGQSLPGNSTELPTAAKGHPAVVLFSFSRSGGDRAQDWIRHLSQEMPDLNIYYAIFLESVPGPLRGMVVSGIKTKTPQNQQNRTLVLYAKTEVWKQQLEPCDVEDVCALLLGPDSHVRWMNGGAFSAISEETLRSQLKLIGHE